MNKIDELKKHMKTISNYTRMESILSWDMEVNMPRNASNFRGELLSQLSEDIYSKVTSSETVDFLNFFSSVSDLDSITSAMVRKLKKSYDNINKIPKEKYAEFSKLRAMASNVWVEAKNKNDFQLFLPYLEKIVEFKREFTEYMGYKDHRYDALLEEYEPGFTVKKLDEVFSELRNEVVNLLKKIQNKHLTYKIDFLEQSIPIESQRELGEYISRTIGFDLERGRIDEVEHPFCTTFNMDDVRITTHYYENNFTSALFSTLHESGHGIYEQNIDKSLHGTTLDDGVSNGIHESQSRFYENIVGRSKGFSGYLLKELKNRFKDEFKNVTENDFYKAINAVNPSLIRIEADELTYSLHVIIRYELEKALMNGDINACDLPKAWNEKYKEYLGIEPPTDSLGVLQDVHWSEGLIGYFPSYALGNLYGAQFLNKMKKNLSEFEKDLEVGNLENITNWLKENVHKHGSIYEPFDLIKKVTGEELSSKYFVEYLNDKYSEIYDL